MKKILPLLVAVGIVSLFSCNKEYSLENGGGGSANIIGADCRIAKIAYVDSASGVGTGSIAAIINTLDKLTDVTKFDSLTATIDYTAMPVYIGDSVFINADEYFTLDPTTKRVKYFHGLVDPTNPSSLQFDETFTYDAGGYLISKSYELAIFPGAPVVVVNYTYAGNNLTQMSATDLTTGSLITTADITFYSNIAPKNFIYLFPDEDTYAEWNQFLNFGKRSLNAVKDLKVRYYDPGNVVRDSAVSLFKTYTRSVDNYITSVIMTGSDQPSIPADAGKLVFSYHCK